MLGLTHHRILVVDDNPAIHDDFRKVLCGSAAPAADGGVDDLEAVLFGSAADAETATYAIDVAAQGQEALDKVRDAQADGRPYAMVFCDMRMPPGWDGVRTLREIWKIAPNLQSAICTAYSDYTPDRIASELGVQGKMVILRKPFDPAEVRQLAAMVCEKADIHRLRGVLEREVQARTADLKRAALQDGLTGLPNRLLFADRLNQSLLRARRAPDGKCAVLFIDCDNFKSVNDSLGHQAGDEMLRQIAGRLRQAIRASDTAAYTDGPTSEAIAARVGGDEFAILLSDLSADADAARVAERLLAASAAPYVLGGKSVHSAMSIGVTTSTLGYATGDDMMRDADAAMYTAKKAGRGRFVIYDQGMHDAAVDRLNFEAELRAAVESGQIRPYYQPIISTATRSLVGFEALARWLHPLRGVIYPADFIQIAEDTGLIIGLGVRIFDDACTQLARWHRDFPDLAGLTMGINLSRKQLVCPSLIDDFRDILRRTGAPPGLIHLEVTESSVMDDARKAVDALNKLRDLGLNLQMDDFGTGYSSLSCLHKFPVHGLKLDHTFVGDLTADPQAHPVLGAISMIAQGMRLPIVAEGVESDRQFEQLRDIGCAFAQGYLFAPPLDAAAATAFITGVVTRVVKAA